MTSISRRALRPLDPSFDPSLHLHPSPDASFRAQVRLPIDRSRCDGISAAHIGVHRKGVIAALSYPRWQRTYCFAVDRGQWLIGAEEHR